MLAGDTHSRSPDLFEVAVSFVFAVVDLALGRRRSWQPFLDG